MGVKLVSASAGSVEIVAPTTASNFTATLPAGTGTMVVNGINGSIVSGAAVNSTSGTSIDFTSIPSWVKRITVMFNGVSTNGSSLVQIQLGAGSVDAASYSSAAATISGGPTITASNSTTGFLVLGSNASSVVFGGIATIALVGSNIWTMSFSGGRSDTATTISGGGYKTLSGTLDRVRITTVNGTDAFDLGSVNILYE